MRVIAQPEEMLATISELRRGGKTIGLVPTMGALHEGHLSLVRASRQACDVTVVTIFVNPAQFGPQEDFGRYPRTLPEDLEMLTAEGVDLVFAPAPEDIYRAGASTWVEPPAVSAPLEGKFRPGHFRGVATIVLKLFHLIPADVAFFGQKDFQQCRVIEQMVRDLDVPITIRRCPIVREPDGLAMSSRNRYLEEDERPRAIAISQALQAGEQLLREEEPTAEGVRGTMQQVLSAAGITDIDYVSVADPETLWELERIESFPVVLLIAARVGQTRLIDNRLVE